MKKQRFSARAHTYQVAVTVDPTIQTVDASGEVTGGAQTSLCDRFTERSVGAAETPRAKKRSAVGNLNIIRASGSIQNKWGDKRNRSVTNEMRGWWKGERVGSP